MDRRAFAVSSLLAFLPTTALAQDKTPSERQTSHEGWVLEQLKEIESLKVGMTRADLLKLFAPEGCIQDRQKHTFYSRACLFFRLDVEFEVGRRPEDQDVIIRISRPYLQREIRIC